MWVTWPKRPKGVNNEVKRPKVRARRAPGLLVLRYLVVSLQSNGDVGGGRPQVAVPLGAPSLPQTSASQIYLASEKWEPLHLGGQNFIPFYPKENWIKSSTVPVMEAAHRCQLHLGRLPYPKPVHSFYPPYICHQKYEILGWWSFYPVFSSSEIFRFKNKLIKIHSDHLCIYTLLLSMLEMKLIINLG